MIKKQKINIPYNKLIVIKEDEILKLPTNNHKIIHLFLCEVSYLSLMSSGSEGPYKTMYRILLKVLLKEFTLQYYPTAKGPLKRKALKTTVTCKCVNGMFIF